MDLFEQKGIKPMLLTEQHVPLDSPDYICELKLDGIRCLAYLGDQTDLRNKRDIPLLGAFPELTDIHGKARRRCILDGELIVASADGSPDFEDLQTRLMLTDPARIRLACAHSPASFVAFDILYCDDNTLMDRPLLERKQLLNENIMESDRIAISRVFENSPALFALTAQRGLEGIVQKRKMSLYHPGKRSCDWIKVKNLIDEDFVACGYIPKGNMCSLVLGQYDGDRLAYQGHVTLGVSLNEAARYPCTENCPFDSVPPGNEQARWYMPLKVCTVRYMERTSGGGMRQPRYKGFRTDKSPRECLVSFALNNKKGII